MRKSRLFFMAALCSTMLFSIGAYASTVNESGFHRNGTYSENVVGSAGTMHAEGTNTYAYTTVYNTTSASYYMEATVKEYVWEKGFVQSKSDYGVVEPGRIVDSKNISRIPSDTTRDYIHTGYIYNSTSTQSGVRDYLKYEALQ